MTIMCVDHNYHTKRKWCVCVCVCRFCVVRTWTDRCVDDSRYPSRGQMTRVTLASVSRHLNAIIQLILP